MKLLRTVQIPGWQRAGATAMALVAASAAAEEPVASASTRWSLEAVGQRFGIEVSELPDGGFQLDGNGVRIRGAKGVDTLEVNRLLYRLEERWEGESPGFHPNDVEGLLDPLLQPARHLEWRGFQDVYLQWEDREGKEEEPVVQEVAKLLGEVLGGYELKVHLGEPIPAEGDVLWVRLAMLPPEEARVARCMVLGHSNPAETEGGVYPGEFFDAESLVLATLIQTGLVLGPGAAGGGAEDGGIHRVGREDFARTPAPAVQVAWGESLDPAHVVKSVAAGILRLQRFLGSREAEAEAFGRREVKLSRVDLREGPGEGEVHLLLNATARAELLRAEGQNAIQFPVRFLVLDEDGLVRMLAGAPTQAEWVEVSQVPGDASGVATVRVTVRLPEADWGRLREGYWGYAVWVVREGVVEDRRATPERLTDQLWRWEGHH